MTTRTQKTKQQKMLSDYYDKHIEDLGKKPKRWRPKIFENYFTVNLFLVVQETTNLDNFIDHKLLKLGNCFRTKREAQAMAKKLLKVLNEGV